MDGDVDEAVRAYPPADGVTIGGIDIQRSIGRLIRDPRQALTVLVCGAALAATATMVVSRFALPSDGSYIPTEAWNWTGDGVEVAPLAPTSPIRAGDIVVAIDGRPLADWASTAVAPPWFLAPQSIGPAVEVVVRRDGRPVDLDVTLQPFSSGHCGATMKHGCSF